MPNIYIPCHFEICRQYSFQRRKYTGNTSESNYAKYTAYITIATSLLGIYFYRTNKEVHALTKKHVQCGEFKANLKTYSLEEVGKHDNKKDGIWVTYKQGVYDVTDFIEKHPGGPSKILMAAGSSIEPFWTIFANHNTTEIYELLESMRIGNISEEDAISNIANENDPYSNEPIRHKALHINGHKPFCAEPPPSLLIESFITPVYIHFQFKECLLKKKLVSKRFFFYSRELFYVRNHLPVPQIDLNTYTLELAIEETTKKTLNIEDIKKYPKYTITSAVMCGGNRRSEMAKVKKFFHKQYNKHNYIFIIWLQEKELKGLSWGVGAVGNATWTGARLYDVLKNLGIDEDNYNHVQV